MKAMVQTLRSSLHSAAGPNFGRLMRSRGVADFLLDCEKRSLEPEELAAWMLTEITEGDAGPFDEIVCLAAVYFLDRVRGSPERELRQQKLRDLKQLLLAGAEKGQFVEWARSWYP